MNIEKMLTIKGIFRGNGNTEYQYYQVMAEDNDGKKYIMSVGCKTIYTEACEKTFSRLLLVPAPKAEDIPPETKEGEDTHEIHLAKS